MDRPSEDEVTNTQYPSCTMLEIEEHFSQTLTKERDTLRLPNFDILGPRATNEMTWIPVTAETIVNAISSKRGSSSPGQDTITNAALKRCPALYSSLAKMFNDLIKFGTCPTSWSLAITRLIHKGGDPKIPRNWRPIALTSCLGKLLHSIIGHQLLDHAVSSGVIETTIQKGFLPRMNGTLEHTQTLCNLLQHHQRKKNQYCLAQIDLRNAFGSLSHDSIFEALTWARVSPEIIEYIKGMYLSATTRFKCDQGLTKEIAVQRGVLQGDTLSPVLFNIAMEIVLRYMRRTCPYYGISYPDTPKHFLKAYVDDLTIITSSDFDMNNAIQSLSIVLRRIGLSINVEKSRVQCMAIRAGTEHPGYMTRRPKIECDGDPIPHICDRGSAFLGMTLAPGAQQARELYKKLNAKLKTWLQNVHRSAHTLPEKLWIYQNVMLARLRYAFTVHPCITFNFILRLQKTATSYIRKWINMASKGSTEVLYSDRGWGLTALSKLWFECTATAMTQMNKSRDINVQAALRSRIEEEQNRRARGQLRPACEILQHLNDAKRAKQIMGEYYEAKIVQDLQKRAPVAAQWWTTPSETELAKEFSAVLNNLNSTKLTRFATSVLLTTPLPSKSNLRTCGLHFSNATCVVCGKEAQTVRHVISGCKTSLDQGRYTLRHDTVLAELAKRIQESPHTKYQHFDLLGHRNPPHWLHNNTNHQRPDGFVALTDGTEFIVELTVPWEENCMQANEYKRLKYNALLHERRTVHPNTYLLVFEIGARGGLVASSADINRLFGGDEDLGAKCRASLSRAAIRSSFLLWHKRDSPQWSDAETLSA